MQDQVWATWMKLNKHTQNNNNKSMNRLRYLHLLLRSTQKKLRHICNSLRSHAWSKHRVRQSSVHAGNAPVLNLPDHGEIPNSFGTRRGRAGDSAERGGRERKGVQTKRKSLNRVRQGTPSKHRDQVHPKHQQPSDKHFNACKGIPLPDSVLKHRYSCIFPSESSMRSLPTNK